MTLDAATYRTVGFLAGAAIAFALQWLSPHAPLRGSWRVNVRLWLLNALVLAVLCGSCVCSAAAWAATVDVGALNAIAAPLWVEVAVTIALLDFVSYLWHRANHRFAVLWRFHRVHHSDPSYTVTTGLRFHPGELLLSLPIRLAVVVAAGAPVAGVLVFECLFNLWNLVEHGNVTLPVALEDRLAYAVVTPALHRRHHTRRRPDLDSNFGTIFTGWDRLLGTFGASSSRLRIETGLPDGAVPGGLLEVLRMPFARRAT
jgi:sterol desaturase/sphingolipid hydroxylase (fatty acid hydroxylase superfamily)